MCSLRHCVVISMLFTSSLCLVPSPGSQNFPEFSRIPDIGPAFPRNRFPHPVHHYDNPHPWPPDPHDSVIHAGLPQGLKVTPLPLKDGDHELAFNVSWLPSLGPPARDYSLEVASVTETEDCKSPMCYEYDIPGDSLWFVIPKVRNPVVDSCALRPGCSYSVLLKAHPWDGVSTSHIVVNLDECESGVCSCGHAPRLPTPLVKAHTLSLNGEIVANVSWTLPPPRFPLRLPPHLRKHYYYVSIGKQMVSDAHPSPWFAHTVSRRIPVHGEVAEGDVYRWAIIPINERSVERSGARERDGEKKTRDILLDVKLLARVSLVDERGCIGPAGNATAYDPAQSHAIRIGTYAMWAAFGGACVLAMIAIIAMSARAVKRVLAAFRQPPVSAPLEPLCRRPAWFPMQLRTSGGTTVPPAQVEREANTVVPSFTGTISPHFQAPI